MSHVPPRLTSHECAQLSTLLPLWQIDDDVLERRFTFADFNSALAFVNRLAPLADTLGHHPDVALAWGRVVVRLSTHDAGGLTSLDVALAHAIDALP
jgi:4a-hydroxytetrahydrobiopterin dehydratase